jgi:hypothetical protein
MNLSTDVFENASCHDVVPQWQAIEREGMHPERRRQPDDNRLSHVKSVVCTNSKIDRSYPMFTSPKSLKCVPTICSVGTTKAYSVQDTKNSYETIPQLLWFHESDSSLDLSEEHDDDVVREHLERHSDEKGPLPRRRRRLIQFDTQLRMREYSVTIGDHPGCEDALPLTLDWAYVESTGLLPENDSGNGMEHSCSTDTALTQCDDTMPKDGSLIQIRPLTMAERRHRLIHVGAYTEEEVDAYLQEYYSGGYIFSVILELLARCLPNRLFVGQPQTIQ